MKTNLFSIMAGWQCVDLTGPDAQDFLNRLSSADFRKMTAGHFTAATLLSATGKIQLYFKAIQLEPQHYLLLLPSDKTSAPAAQAGHDAFERMHFRENIQLTPEPDCWTYVRIIGSDSQLLEQLAGTFPAASQAAKAPLGTAVVHSDGIFLNESKWCSAPIVFDIGAVVNTTQLPALLQVLESNGFEERSELEGFRIRAGDPAVPGELGATTMPLEAALNDAVHENKGCYPGQEVVERIRSMGQVPRSLVLFRGEGAPPQPGQAILSDSSEAGSVTSATLDPIDGGWVALGFVKRVHIKDSASYTIAGQTVAAKFRSSIK